MAAKRLQRPKKKKRVKAANATTRSTAGSGFAFEDQIGAYLLLQMFMGESLPGSDDAVGSRLQTQTKALRWSIDDLLATSDPGTDTQRQLAVSCKSSHQVTAAGLPKDFVLAAWEQWSRSRNGPMKRDRDSLMLATRGHHLAFETLWADAKNWSTGDPKIALARIGATAKHRKFFKSIKEPIKKVKRNVRDGELIRFTRRLEVMATDFDLANSEDRRKAIGRSRNLLNGGKLTDGRKLWEALVASAREARLGNGTVELASLSRSEPCGLTPIPRASTCGSTICACVASLEAIAAGRPATASAVLIVRRQSTCRFAPAGILLRGRHGIGDHRFHPNPCVSLAARLRKREYTR
jgi:hypothetical protein